MEGGLIIISSIEICQKKSCDVNQVEGNNGMIMACDSVVNSRRFHEYVGF